MSKTPARTCAVLGLVMAGLTPAAQAQIGSGWTRYSPEFDVHRQGSGQYSKSGGTEKFTISATGVVGKTGQRSEIRLHNGYSSGQRQFEGYLKVVRLDGTKVSLKQTMMTGGHAFFMLSVKAEGGGQLYDHGNSGAGTFISGVVGRTIRVNTIHDENAGTLKLYLNGSLKYTRTTPAGKTWVEKYGAYKTLSGLGPITAEWSNVNLWRSDHRHLIFCTRGGAVFAENNGITGLRRRSSCWPRATRA